MRLIFSLVSLVLSLSACGLKLGTGNPSVGTHDGTLLPLEAGRTWTYQVSLFGGGSCQGLVGQQATQKVLSVGTVAGMTAYQLTELCATEQSDSYTYNGNQILILYQNQWVTALDLPSEGHQWWSGSASFVWNSSPQVTTAAGSFSGCWTRSQNLSASSTIQSSYTTYCPSVGMVINHIVDANGNGWHAQLASKNFHISGT